MQNSNIIKSILFVAVQFVCLGLIALSGPLIPSNPALLILLLLGLGLGVWAILAMRIGNFNIAPDPLARSQLVTSGPYSKIRHPMYLALLLATIPLVINSFDPLRFSIWLILLIDLLLKLNYEEKLLVVKLAGYDQYRKRSYRLIPFVY
jgi:protein-S-isoprenylcysteine O-methyltransferase Ste14